MSKIGVIGVGGMGSAHCSSLNQVERAEFVGVYDLSPEAAAQAAEKFGVRAFESEADLLSEVDCVIVATPGFYHTDPVVSAAKAGVHVFVEKPMADNVEDCDRMIEAADEGGAIIQVGMVLRFYPAHELGMKMLKDGVIGDLVYIETDYSGSYRAPRARPESWYGKMGGLLENGIHKVDLINWFGGKVKTVAAEVGSFSGHDDWEDYVTGLIRYDTDVVGILRWGGFMGARGTTDTFLDGSKGSLRMCIGSQTVFRKLLGEDDWTEIVPEDQKRNTVAAELQHFIDCIEEGKTPIIDGRQGKDSVELAHAIYQSAKNGEKVRLE
ncbi:MAG: Gfo/Idh/MocA family oxidoreductase [Planctomycetota bacterium]|nr:Gfo/Idh/MocA family oxidoreductase [Planctomycetota bacterium]